MENENEPFSPHPLLAAVEDGEVRQLQQTTEFMGIPFDIYGTIERPLFLAADVAELIEYANLNVVMMLQSIDPNEKLISKVLRSGQRRDMWFLTEDGLYEVLMQSTKPTAKEFKLVIKRVLRELRQKGMVVSGGLGEDEQIAAGYAILQRRIVRQKELNNQLFSFAEEQLSIIEEMQPKAAYVDMLKLSKGLLAISQIAQDYGMSGMAMNQLLLDYGIQRKINGQWVINMPYKIQGYVQSKTFQVPDKHTGDMLTVLHTYWTPNGRMFLYFFLKERGHLPLIEQNRALPAPASRPEEGA